MSHYFCKSVPTHLADRSSFPIVLGYDPLLSPQFLQTEIPAVSHSRLSRPSFPLEKTLTDRRDDPSFCTIGK